jgi:dihydrodipicolinate synthase/N-acetylneuraminate lyase
MTRPPRISGAFAPIPTPVDRTGELELGALRRHLSWLGGSRLDGAVVLGSNGEFPSFTLDERRRIAAAAADAASGLRLILGVGSCALGEVLAMAGEAARHGYDAVLCPPPFYFRRPSPRGLTAFFARVLDATPVPVLLYHIPQLTGVPIDDELLDMVGDHDRLAGAKDSSGDPAEMRRLLGRLGGRSYLVGNDRLVRACRLAGGSGSITAAASVVPGIVAEAADDDAAQEQLNRVRGLLEEYGIGPAVKALLRRWGFGSYGSRPPLVGLEGDPDRAAELVRRFDEITGPAATPR